MHYFKNFSDTNQKVLISGKSPNAGTSGTTIKNLNVLDNLLTYGSFAAGTVSVSSSNQAADIAAGTGARKVTVFGLSAITFLPIYEEFTMHATDGRTAVVGTKQFSRVFAAEVTASGTGLTNAGDIYAYTTGTALTAGVPTALTTTWVKILLGEGSGSNGFYTVPMGKKASIPNFLVSNRTQIATISIWAKHPTLGSLENFFQFSLPTTSPVLDTNILANCFEFSEQTDLYIRIVPATTLALANASMLLNVKNAS